MGILKRSSEKCKERRSKSCQRDSAACIQIEVKDDAKVCCEPEICCEQQGCECECKCQVTTCCKACCKPGCSPRMPCLACIKNGVKVQIIANKCRKPCVQFQDCSKKLTIRSRCEIKRNDCCVADETDCCIQKSIKCKQDDCKTSEDDVIDYCKLARECAKEEPVECKTVNVQKSNSCRSLKPYPCMKCRCIDCCDKCEITCGNDNDDEKCCKTSCMKRNSCKTSKQIQECVPKNTSCLSSSCPKSCSFMENCCNENVVDEKCAEYEQGDCMSYYPIQEANCCGFQNISNIPSTCLPSVGSFVVPNISKQATIPCPCGFRSCSNPGLVFQQAIQPQSCYATKRFP